MALFRFLHIVQIVIVIGLAIACHSAAIPNTSTVAVSTALPISPPTAISRITDIPKPIETPISSSTPDTIATASIEFIMGTVRPSMYAVYPSPNGKWRVEVIRYECIKYTYQDYMAIIAYEQLKIINLSDGTGEFVDDQLQNCDGIGMAGLGGLYWSPSNRYFYYTDSREGYPETCGNYAVPAIYRLDTVVQETTLIGGGHISPDKTRLAMWQENEIVIWDLDKGEIGRVLGLIPDTLNGDIAWSPDGKSIVYLQTTFDCAPDYGRVYVIHFNLAALSQDLLLEHESPGFGKLGWGTPDQIILRDGMNKIWIYNLISRELKPSP